MPIYAEFGAAEPARRSAMKAAGIGRRARPEGPATVLAIGTANPPTVIEQAAYPDYYFNVTGCNHMVDFKRKFRNICDKTAIRKRHSVISADVVASNPDFCSASLDTRQALVLPSLLELAEQASSAALSEWGRPTSDITHLVYCSTAPGHCPGTDLYLAQRLGLRTGVRRVALFQQGCHGGGVALRVARDLAESTLGARVLVVCAETASLAFRRPQTDRVDGLVAAALFGDGAAAAVVGADLDQKGGKESAPLFEMLSASQKFVPGTQGDIGGELTEAGLTARLSNNVPSIVAGTVEECLMSAAEEACAVELLKDWNSLFWVVHPGGRAILDRIEERLGLMPEKLRATRKVLEEYGNMAGASVLFVMDEMRRRSQTEGLASTGEGKELGMLLAFGPGVTVETILLRSFPAGVRPMENK